MAGLLGKLAVEWHNPFNPLASSARANELKHLIKESKEPEEKLQLIYRLGQEELNAGRSEEAVNTLLEVFAVLFKNRGFIGDETILDAWKMLGLSYLRLGQVENDLASTSSDAFFFPTLPGGRHRIDRGSRSAIKIYEALLTDFPGDLGTIYLMNLAAMNLGRYPDALARNVRIPEHTLDDKTGQRRFRNIASAAGLDVRGHAGGVVMDDLNGDGWLDLMVSSKSLNEPIRCFLNDGQGGFLEHTSNLGLMGIGGGLNLIHADYDNDGDIDVFVLRGGGEGAFGRQPNSLLRNDGRAGFEDVTVTAGLFSQSPTRTAAWGDFNRDGHLDLFVGNESGSSRNPQTGQVQVENHPCELFVNQGDGTFRESSQSLGLSVKGVISGVAWGDTDNDGFLDLFISDQAGENLLFRNRGPDADGRWRFEEIGREAGVSEPRESSTTWFWDANNDGWLDLFVSGYSVSRLEERMVPRDSVIDLAGLEREAERLWLYENNGDGTFTDVTVTRDLDHVAYTLGGNHGDLNGDGWPDFYLGTGAPDLNAIVPNRMFLNEGGERFQEVTISGGFGHLGKGHGTAFGDLDGDGDQDLYVVTGGMLESDRSANLLFENPGNRNRWLTVKLVGTTGPRDAIGACIAVVLDTSQGERNVFANVLPKGSGGSSPFRQTVGLGSASAIINVIVRWPATSDWIAYGPVDFDQSIQITEGEEGLQVETTGEVSGLSE